MRGDNNPTRGTVTSAFGVSRRENHDSSRFYARFTPPIIDEDEEIGDRPDLPDHSPLFGDARCMSELPDKSVALVVTSPPYFVGKEYEDEVVKAVGSDLQEIPGSYGEYLDMLHGVFTECVRVLEPGGRIAVNVANLGRKPYRSLSADVIRILEGLGLLLRGEIIWQKGKTTSGSCAWGSFMTPSNPVFRDVTERIVIASKGRFDRALSREERRSRGYPHVATVSNDEFVETTRDIWEIPAESARRVDHPAPFPVELPLKLIDLFTYEDDLVLDPFMGSGSTLVAAHKARRRSVGYDIDPRYVELARGRLQTVRPRLPMISGVQEEFDITLPESEWSDHFQVRATQQGKKAQDLARNALEQAGFFVDPKPARLVGSGIEFNFLVKNSRDQRWFVDVSGAFTTVRPGLQRTDTLWKMLGKALVLRKSGTDIPLLVMTSNLPKIGSEGWKALKSVGPESVFDAIEIFRDADLQRLAHYGRIDGEAPLPGFWEEHEIVE